MLEVREENERFLQFCLHSSHFHRCFSRVYSLHHLKQLWENTCALDAFFRIRNCKVWEEAHLCIRSQTCKWQNQIGISDCLDLGKSSFAHPCCPCLEFRGKMLAVFNTLHTFPWWPFSSPGPSLPSKAVHVSGPSSFFHREGAEFPLAGDDARILANLLL